MQATKKDACTGVSEEGTRAQREEKVSQWAIEGGLKYNLCLKARKSLTVKGTSKGGGRGQVREVACIKERAERKKVSGRLIVDRGYTAYGSH